MAGTKRHDLDGGLEVGPILSPVKDRWLRPAEVCEIIRNHHKFHISSEPAHMPLVGARFLFNKKMQRYFRKDGHNWRKKKDGKTVRESNEILKVGSVDALRCYYAHGHENENFQRRSYSMLEVDLSHIVLVHYREVQTSEGDLSCSSGSSINQNMHSDTIYHVSTSFHGGVNADELLNSRGPPCYMDLMESSPHWHSDKHMDLMESSPHWHSDKKNNPQMLKNLDSSNQFMNTELEGLTEPQMLNSEDHLNTISSENGIDGSSTFQQDEIAPPGSSLSRDLLFNIIDLSPNWAYENSETKVLVIGRFLKSQELDSFKWSCMFGDVEVPAKVVTDSVLCCYTPIHQAARVPFFVTCSNKLACSEVRIFEYRVNRIQDAGLKDNFCEENTLVMHLGKSSSQSFTNPSCNTRVKHRQYICVSENSDLTVRRRWCRDDQLRDSFTAICNATQAAARIHQVFRAQSFQRKQLKEYDGDKFGISKEIALSLIAVKSHEAGKRDEHVDAAAVRIQNKFRSWKGRKDYLIIRQRIVKIQAHVRGHKVRKEYKITMRWRREGSGLRGFKPEPITEGPGMQVSFFQYDDVDILKEGRMQQALARVKSMAQYPEARDQCRRLLNVVTEIQETKVLYSSEGTSTYMDDDLIDVEALFDVDILMSTAAS